MSRSSTGAQPDQAGHEHRAPARKVPVMSPGATFERVYRALKVELGSVRFGPGDAHEPALLADLFNSSVTPVRDALHRLVGEGLVAAPRSDGFRVPILTEVGLRHLYAWSQWLLMRSVALRPEGREQERQVDQSGDVDALFLTIAGWTGNPEHLAAMVRVNDRLRPIRVLETGLIEDVASEVRGLEQAAAESRSTLRNRIALYHRRRARAAAEIVEAVHRR